MYGRDLDTYHLSHTACLSIKFLIVLHRALNWQVHPPTAYCFGKHMLYLLPCSAVSMDDRHAILELARFLTELSVIDYFFVIHKPSVVALAAILNAMEDISTANLAIPTFCNEIKKSTPLDPSDSDVFDCCTRLRLLYAQGGYAHACTERTEFRSETVSPVCVSYGCQPTQAYRSKHQGY
jgi:Cyclin, C-terminal domain